MQLLEGKIVHIFDGVRGQCDKIRISSVVIEQQLHLDRAYTVMQEGSEY